MKKKNGGFIAVCRRFFLPELKALWLLRVIIIAAVTAAAGVIFRPCYISGSSMEPNWHDGAFTLSFRWRYTFTPVKRGDVVTLAYFGRKQLLKRVVALPGDRVGFRNGKLFVNGSVVDEPYVKNPCNWDVPEITVREGCCFVAGDNRSQKKTEHLFGETGLNRITGGPLF